jgi:hypothetical protein
LRAITTSPIQNEQSVPGGTVTDSILAYRYRA